MREIKMFKRETASGKRIYTFEGVEGLQSTSLNRDYVAILLDTDSKHPSGYYVRNRFGRMDLIGKGDSAHAIGHPDVLLAVLENEEPLEEVLQNEDRVGLLLDKGLGLPPGRQDAPTTRQYGAFQELYDYLNVKLFKGELTPCLLTMIPSKRNNGGHFWPEKWQSEDGKPTHEISMNPHGYAIEEPEFFVSILVHEMVHQYMQDHTDKPARKGYHCRNWGAKMKEVGLYPSNTGQEGGKETGQKMSHYIVEGGLYQEAFQRMDPALLLPFRRFEAPKKEKKRSKLKYICPSCEASVWGKAGLKVRCGEEACEGQDMECLNG